MEEKVLEKHPWQPCRRIGCGCLRRQRAQVYGTTDCAPGIQALRCRLLDQTNMDESIEAVS